MYGCKHKKKGYSLFSLISLKIPEGPPAILYKCIMMFFSDQKYLLLFFSQSICSWWFFMKSANIHICVWDKRGWGLKGALEEPHKRASPSGCEVLLMSWRRSNRALEHCSSAWSGINCITGRFWESKVISNSFKGHIQIPIQSTLTMLFH